MIRVLIVDAHTILRHGLRLILQEDPAITVVGEAESGAEAVEKVTALKPDVVLMDLQLPDLCGTKIIQQIRAINPSSQIVVLTVSNQSEKMLTACTAGAKGYLLKSISGADIVDAMHKVAAGQAVLPDSLTTHLLDQLANPTPTPDPLTDRELEVLQCMTTGLGNKEIAMALSISQNTVKTHVRHIFAKLNLRNRTEAAAYAMQSEILA